MKKIFKVKLNLLLRLITTMNPIKKVRLCEDNIKYLLMGVVSPCIDQVSQISKQYFNYQFLFITVNL